MGKSGLENSLILFNSLIHFMNVNYKVYKLLKFDNIELSI